MSFRSEGATSTKSGAGAPGSKRHGRRFSDTARAVANRRIFWRRSTDPLAPWHLRVITVTAWTLVVLFVSAFFVSLAIPLWYQLQNQQLLLVTSGSMEPDFAAGDAVVLQKISDPSQLREGQVVSFYPIGSDELTTHRIVELVFIPVIEHNPETGEAVNVVDPETGQQRFQHYVITKGDANELPDPNAIPISRIRGLVLEAHVGWGYILDWAYSPVGRLILLAPPLLIIASLEVASILRERKHRRPPRKTGHKIDVDKMLLE